MFRTSNIDTSNTTRQDLIVYLLCYIGHVYDECDTHSYVLGTVVRSPCLFLKELMCRLV
jgi:hypothetical protein